MGWMFTSLSKESLVRDLLYDSPTCKTIAHRVVGNTLWSVAEKSTGERFILCDLLEGSGQGWGYKSMDESVHPYYYDCPIDFLDMVPEVACQEWRDKVRAGYRPKP